MRSASKLYWGWDFPFSEVFRRRRDNPTAIPIALRIPRNKCSRFDPRRTDEEFNIAK
jgi:hypothetical protein